MLRLALLLAVPVAVVGEGIALRVSDFEVGAEGMLPAEKCFGGGNEYCVPRLEGVCAADRWCGLLPESFFSTEQGTVAGRAGTIPIVSESADPEGRKMAQLLSEDVMATMQEGVHFEIVGVKVGAGGLVGAAKALLTKPALMFHDENDELHFVYPGKESGCYQRVSHAKVQKLRCYLAIALVRPAPPAPGGSG
jgi:hypothetical protein